MNEILVGTCTRMNQFFKINYENLPTSKLLGKKDMF